MKRSRRVRTTRPAAGADRAPDLVERDFTAEGPDRLWVTDLFPEADPELDGRWTHYRQSTFHTVPEYDLRFVGELLDEITTAGVFTAANGDLVAADPERIYAAGFSNGSGMVWQLAYSTPAMMAQFSGFATVSTPLVSDKPQKYQARFGAAPPVPMIYINGTLDTTFSSPRTLQEIPVDMSYRSYTVQEMLNRNGVAAGAPASTQLVPGSTNITEVFMQEWVGSEAFACVLVINGGHNWPTLATNSNPPVGSHFNTTRAIVEFWQNHAGLP